MPEACIAAAALDELGDSGGFLVVAPKNPSVRCRPCQTAFSTMYIHVVPAPLVDDPRRFDAIFAAYKENALAQLVVNHHRLRAILFAEFVEVTHRLKIGLRFVREIL